MKSLIQIFLFLASFTLEIRVYGAESGVQQEPPGCLKADGPCALENQNERGFEFKVGDAVVTLDRDAAVIRKSRTEVRLVKGTIWVRAGTNAFTVSSEFGSVSNLSKGDFWVSKSLQQVSAFAVSTDVELAPRGSAERLTVGQGLQNTLGEIGFNGQAATALPMPIAFKDHVMRWGRLYKGPKKEFEEQVDAFHAKWEDATMESAAISKVLVDRKLAAADEAARAEAERKAKVEAENRALREMFRKRHGL